MADTSDSSIYRSVTVYFTTGTGNAYRGASWLVEAAAAAGAKAQLVNMHDADPAHDLEPGPASLLAVFAPTHGFTAPWSVIRFALRLPRGRGAHAVTGFTRAGTKFGRVFLPGFDGTANYLIALILWLKGYCVRGVVALDLPSNWMSLHPGYGRPSAEAMVARQRVRMSGFAARILAGRRSFGHFVSLFFGIAVLPVSLGYLLVGRFFLAKLFFASGRCNGCGLCAQACARHAIRMWGKEPRPYWTLDCESCMRCMAFCPTQAIEAGHSLGALFFVVAAWLPLDAFGARWLSAAVPALRPVLENEWVRMVLYWAWVVVATVLVYGIVALALRVRLLNKLFTYTTFTHLYHRYREPGTKLKAIVGKDVDLRKSERD
jgi:Pyruvate/2-oxoacid:ferredoxin oxidoreductase delta subunit